MLTDDDLAVVRDALTDAIFNAECQIRGGIVDEPLRSHLTVLCGWHGYGNVIASCSRLWRDKDPGGAFAYGMCVSTVERSLEKMRAALARIEGTVAQ